MLLSDKHALSRSDKDNRFTVDVSHNQEISRHPKHM
jgi:hypothetical protein